MLEKNKYAIMNEQSMSVNKMLLVEIKFERVNVHSIINQCD
jgi:hypothetical protein